MKEWEGVTKFVPNLCELHFERAFVVYFDQHWGAAHSKRSSKSSFYIFLQIFESF